MRVYVLDSHRQNLIIYLTTKAYIAVFIRLTLQHSSPTRIDNRELFISLVIGTGNEEVNWAEAAMINAKRHDSGFGGKYVKMKH